MGLEPTTTSLEDWNSTVELLLRLVSPSGLELKTTGPKPVVLPLYYGEVEVGTGFEPVLNRLQRFT